MIRVPDIVTVKLTSKSPDSKSCWHREARENHGLSEGLRTGISVCISTHR